MVRNIFEIGSGKYQFGSNTLNSFLEESRNRPSTCGPAEVPGAGQPGGELHEMEMQGIFSEVMALYHDYMRCQNVEVLLRLKSRLEEFSLRYKSHVLAAEVLNINSCLPYEHRVPAPGKLPGKDWNDPDSR